MAKNTYIKDFSGGFTNSTRDILAHQEYINGRDINYDFKGRQLENLLCALDVVEKFAKKRESRWSSKKYNCGAIIYFNHSQDSDLNINGGNAVHYDKPFDIKSKQGQKELEKIITDNEDGAIEIGSGGKLHSYHREFNVKPSEIAVGYGLAESERNVPYQVWGFKKPVGTRHQCTMAASYLDPNAYFLTLSEQTGDMRLIHNRQIINSTVPSEISPAYRPFINTRLAYSSPNDQNSFSPYSIPPAHESVAVNY